MKKFTFMILSVIAFVLIISLVFDQPMWLVCCIPLALAALLLMALFSGDSYSSQETLIRTSGIETEGRITQSELYTGDGLQPNDSCFKGEFEFFDEQGLRHVGHFNGHCYDPFDYLSSDKFLEFGLEYYYRVGGTATVKYLPQDPSKYIFFGPELTYIEKPSGSAK